MDGIVGMLTSERTQAAQPALLFGDSRLTYGELVQRVTRLANGLATLGVRRGDRIGLLLLNSTEFIETFFAITGLGAIAVPLNFRLAGPELEYIVNDSEMMALVCGAEFVDLLSHSQSRMPSIRAFVVVGGAADTDLQPRVDYADLAHSGSAAPLSGAIDGADDALIMYTSGTTGHPKGAVYTHDRMLWNARALAGYFGFRASDVAAVFGPLFHGGSLLCVVMPTLYAGGAVVLMASGGFRAEQMLEVIQRSRATTTLMYPTTLYDVTQLATLETFDYSSLRLVLTGGAPVPVGLMRQFFERFPRSVLIQVFGLTEGPLITTFLAPEDSVRKVGSIGKPAPGVEVVLVTAGGNRAATGEVGEIVGRSPGVVRGYWRKPEATRETFRNGWCHTGDLGYVDGEGFFYIVGRKKEMIISGAENIYPIEVEQTLATHPSVAEAAVVGTPDPRWGEVVKAFIVLKPGAQCTADELIAYCKTRLASYKKPRHVEFVDALPRNASGKVLKQLLLKTEARVR